MADLSKIPEGLISKTEFFEAKTPITKVIPAVQSYDAVVVNKNGEYFGIVDTRTIYKYMQDLKMPKTETVEKFVVRVPRITDTTSIDDVIYFFYKVRAKALPYARDNKIKGILKRTTMLKVLLSLNKLAGIKVAEAMSTPLIAIDVNLTVAQAKATMRENKINRLAAVENGKLVGIITNYDIVGNFLKTRERLPERKSQMYSPSNITLDNVIERNPRKIDQGRSLKDAVKEIVENNISSLIVTRGDRPVGIITELDILTSAAATGGTEANKIFVSGLDADTYQYEDEIKDMLKSFIGKIEKMRNMNVEFISVVVKKFKTKSYEVHARLSLGREGIISSHITGHIFERTFSDLLDNLTKEVKKKKEKYLSIRKILHGAHASDELE